MKQKIILDCDPGHDDALAILLAAHHPNIDLLAITTVVGNQSVEKTTRNALKVCSLANLRTVPIAMGMDCPLARLAPYATAIHGESGLDGADIPEPTLKLAPIHGVDLIIELLLKSDGDITLVLTGPLTNIATAMRREPAILPKIKAISLMGGAIGLGNVTPAAEFNIYVDPEAAEIVFASGCLTTMVPLEVTHQVLATNRVFEQLRDARRPVADIATDLLAYSADTYRRTYGFPAPPIHDPCAVAAVAQPDILSTRMMRVEVETKGEWTIGRTVCDVYGRLGREAQVHVGCAIDVPRFWEMMISTILTY